VCAATARLLLILVLEFGGSRNAKYVGKHMQRKENSKILNDHTVEVQTPDRALTQKQYCYCVSNINKKVIF